MTTTPTPTCDPLDVLRLLRDYGVSWDDADKRGRLANKLANEGELGELHELLRFYEGRHEGDPEKAMRLFATVAWKPDRAWRDALVEARHWFEARKRRGAGVSPEPNGGEATRDENNRTRQAMPGYRDERDYHAPYQRMLMDQAPAGVVAQELRCSLGEVFQRAIDYCREEGIPERQAMLRMRVAVRSTMKALPDWQPPAGLIEFVGGMKRLREGEPDTPARKLAAGVRAEEGVDV